jgi:plastocyanin
VRGPARRESRRGLRMGAVVLVGAASLVLAACGGSGSGHGSASGPAVSPGSDATQSDSITITNFMYSPMAVSVAPGATVHVTNRDSVTHTLTATGGQFDSGDVGPGQTKTFTAPTKPGTYGYICNIHQYMKGTVVVR